MHIVPMHQNGVFEGGSRTVPLCGCPNTNVKNTVLGAYIYFVILDNYFRPRPQGPIFSIFLPSIRIDSYSIDSIGLSCWQLFILIEMKESWRGLILSNLSDFRDSIITTLILLPFR